MWADDLGQGIEAPSPPEGVVSGEQGHIYEHFGSPLGNPTGDPSGDPSGGPRPWITPSEGNEMTAAWQAQHDGDAVHAERAVDDDHAEHTGPDGPAKPGEPVRPEKKTRPGFGAYKPPKPAAGDSSSLILPSTSPERKSPGVKIHAVAVLLQFMGEGLLIWGLWVPWLY